MTEAMHHLCLNLVNWSQHAYWLKIHSVSVSSYLIPRINLHGELMRNECCFVSSGVAHCCRASLRKGSTEGQAEILRKRDKYAIKWLITFLVCAGENNGLIIPCIILCTLHGGGITHTESFGRPTRCLPATARLVWLLLASLQNNCLV